MATRLDRSAAFPLRPGTYAVYRPPAVPKLAAVFVVDAGEVVQHWMLFPGFPDGPADLLICGAALQCGSVEQFLRAARREGGPDSVYVTCLIRPGAAPD
jgi:hypothetical protein